jgi:hypothetical protein
MSTPTLPTDPGDREILKEFISTYANREWLRGANVIPNHPSTFRKTLEVHVNYRPVNEMFSIQSFVQKYNIALQFIQVLQEDDKPKTY